MSSLEKQPLIEHFPPLPSSALSFAAPVRKVTLLEDRAQVERRGRLRLQSGQHRLVIPDVAFF